MAYALLQNIFALHPLFRGIGTAPPREGETSTLSKNVKLLTSADCFKLKPGKGYT